MALVLAASDSRNLIHGGALNRPLLEPKPKKDAQLEKVAKAIDSSCYEHLPAYKEGRATPTNFHLGKESNSPVPANTDSCSGDKTEDLVLALKMAAKATYKEGLRLCTLNLEKKGRSELTWEEKVMKVLHIVRCHKFTEYDPKTCSFICTRFCKFNMAFFDFEKESRVEPGPPLSNLNRSAWSSLETSVNVISLKIVASDVGYPIYVFGTVLARDQVDYKCVYLFKRDKEDPQLITSEKDMLTLTGPYRGLAVTDCMFLEINLKIKCEDNGERDFGKGVIAHNAISYTRHTMKMLLTSWLSTVEFVCAPVHYAVEATIAISILKGPRNFMGKVIAWTTRNSDSQVILYDSEAAGTITKVGKSGSVKLSRCVVAVSLNEKLVLNICVSGRDGFKLKLGQQDVTRICNIGSLELQVKVTWTSNLVSRRKRVCEAVGSILLLQ